MEYPKIAVFCGFRAKGRKASEKDFVYRLLEIFETGKLKPSSLKSGVGRNLTARSPVFGKFYLVEELGEDNPVVADIQLLNICDLALVILPNRKISAVSRMQDYPTSVYVLMEYGLVCGANIPGIVIAEKGVPIDKLGFAPLLHRWPDDIDNKTIRDEIQQKRLKTFFDKIVKSYYLKKPLVAGLTKYGVDEFYRNHLIPLLLQWHDVRIYNHSILPLSSSFDPADNELEGQTAWDTFKGVQSQYASQPHRTLYFELEEALLTGSSARIQRMVKTIGRAVYDPKLLSLLRRPQIAARSKRFSLSRHASLVPSTLLDILSGEEKARVVARNLSILLQMVRLNREYKKGKHVNYELHGFKTLYPYSMPTTVYAEYERKPLGGDSKRTAGIWGFLRSDASLEQPDRFDAFIIARNSGCVGVWERHLDEISRQDWGAEQRQLIYPNQPANFKAFFELVGDEMKDDLRQEIRDRKWSAVLKEVGLR